MAPKTISVIDPVNRTGKIVVPMELTDETRGLTEFLKTAQKTQRDLSLCLLFQKGKCNAGNRCHQIHADRDFVTSLREKAGNTSSCCAAHGDVHSTTLVGDVRKVQVVSVEGNVSIHTLQNFGATQALENLIRNSTGTIRVTANKICRLHGQSRCKFGRDCKNIHFCRDIVNSSAQSSASSTPERRSPVVRPADIEATPAAEPQTTPIRQSKRSVMPPQPADYFRLDEINAAPTPCKAVQTPSLITPSSSVGYSPMSSSFQIVTPVSSTTSVASKTSAILRPLRASDLHDTHQAQVNLNSMFDAVLLQPLTRSRIGISPSAGSSCQSELDIRRLCDDIIGSMSPSWISA